MNEFENQGDLMKELTETLSALQTGVKSSERFDSVTAGEHVKTIVIYFLYYNYIITFIEWQSL